MSRAQPHSPEKYMTQSPKIPSFLTLEELRELWQEAIPEDIAHDFQSIEKNPEVQYGKQKLTEVELNQLAQDCIENLIEKCSDPLAQKVLLHFLLHRLLLSHSLNAECLLEASDPRASSYLYDVGKIQSMISIAETIAVGPNDFTCEI